MGEEKVNSGRRMLENDLMRNPVVREMKQFRTVRWIIAVSIVGFLWLLGAFSAPNAWKAWVASMMVLGVAVYFEVQSLASGANDTSDLSPSDNQNS